MKKILVIKHSALGDFVLATGPMLAIRKANPDAHITLLTTKMYAGWGKDCGWFNDVWVDERPALMDIPGMLRLRQQLRGGNFDYVYDLQTSTRSSSYYYLMQPHKAGWSGVVGSHPHKNPRRGKMHTIDRQREQLKVAGISSVPLPDLSWLRGDVSKFQIKGLFAILVPGGSAHRHEKRWPPEYYIEAAEFLHKRGIIPVLIGAGADAGPIGIIAERCPFAVNLLGKTSFGDIVELGRHAVLALGNDTGPMHLIAPTRCQSLVLFSSDSNPALCAPRGENVRILAENHLKDLHPAPVLAILEQFLINQKPRQYGAASAS